MITSEVSASQFLNDLSQRTTYLFEWRQGERKTPPPPNRKLSLQELRRNYDHVAQNKQSLRREASKRYGLKEWEGKQSLIHRVEYPMTSDDPDAIEQAFLMSKMLFHEAAPLPYAVITLTPNPNKQPRSSSIIASQIAKAQREIIRKREAQLHKVIASKTHFRPDGKLLPSIPMKRVRIQKPAVAPQQKMQPPKQPRRLSLPNFQQQQNIIRLIQF